jgi:hypothetical protein
MASRKNDFLILFACICATGFFIRAEVLAQESDGATSAQAAEAELEEAAKRPEVQEELEEPDGVSVEDLDTDNWKIFAMGTGTYEFNDAEERKDAVEEATLEAKAALAKFMKEELSAESSLDILAERESKKSKANGETNSSATSNRMKTSLTRIRNSANEILSGVIPLESTHKWDGNSGEVRVKIGQSEKTLAAATKFKKRTLAAVEEAGSSGKAAGEIGAGAGAGAKAGAQQPSTTKKKSKSAF